MKILTFTILFPNNVWPNNGVFTKERMGPLVTAKACEVKVVAPVPYFPPLKLGHRYKFSQVVKHEWVAGIETYHPRYVITPKVGMSTYGVLMFLGALSTIRRIQKTYDFDVIDAHFVYPDGLAAVLLKRYFGKPLVVTSHGTDLNLYPKFPLVRRQLQYAMRHADRVITVCQALREVAVVLGVSAEKVAMIPNGIDPSKFHPMSKERARWQLGLPDKKIILSVGSLIPRKGVDYLVKALRILIDRYDERDACLVIVGDGPFHAEIERLVDALVLRQAVRFVGSVPHKDLCTWFSAADIFALASDREGWPCVLLESLACGTPVVATEIWGTPEVITSSQYGFLTVRQEDDIAEKLMHAVRKRWESAPMIEHAQGFTWAKLSWAVYEVFAGVVGSGVASRSYLGETRMPACSEKSAKKGAT